MGVFHFLNVLEGDCSIIQHPSENVTVVDVNNAAPTVSKGLREATGIRGDFRQRESPVNPIEYLKDFDLSSVFRFILTHPDMDHMGGIKAFFEEFGPTNFWDTDNTEGKEFEEGSPFNELDWLFYKNLRDGEPETYPKRLSLLSGVKGQYYNVGEDGSEGGDGLYVLAPTGDLVEEANEKGEFNDASYVILYRSEGGRILLCGDSHDRTWDHILEKYPEDVDEVDVLIAPHHGRKSDRSFKFLDIVKPKLTFFGNAPSEHLAYDAWRSRGLVIVTNNQAGCMVVDTDVSPMKFFVTHKNFAEKVNKNTWWSERHKAYYVSDVK